MENIITSIKDYPFDDIKLKMPRALQGGTYTSNLVVNDNPLLIQTPKCKTKNGIHKTAKHLYCDLLFNNDNKDFIDWFDTLQEKIRNLILENADNWFHEPPTIDEIEYNWNNSIRTYKSNYLIRTFVHKIKGINKLSLQIYDTDENEVTTEDIDSEKNVVCILEIIGLKFSSNSFHLEIALRQIMIINEKPIFNKCLIKLNKKLETGEKNINLENHLSENLEKTTNENIKNIVDNSEEQDEENKYEKENEHQHEEETEQEEETGDEEENKQKNIKLEITDNNNIDDLKTEKENNENNDNNNIQQEQSEPEQSETENIVNNKEDNDSLEKSNVLEEFELNLDNTESIQLKEPTEVYLDIYKKAREKAKKLKLETIKAYLEAKKIKELYMLDNLDSSSEDEEEYEDELFSEN